MATSLIKDPARQAADDRLAYVPKARSVSLDGKGETLKIELTNDVVFLVPTRLIQIFDGAAVDEIKNVEILLSGMYLRWPSLDEDMRVQSLLEGTFGTAKWMNNLKEHLAEIGRKGGSRRSAAKTEAARINGLKGGRPRKVKVG
ncbi:MAG: DUF2442 domain-containing protein [Pyrinomonadaceae bacterium]